jgi:hypothetical protein
MYYLLIYYLLPHVLMLRILYSVLQGDSYRTGLMNLLIIPQMMHITAHNYDIIRGPCLVQSLQIFYTIGFIP